jgi:hypothetical protein
MPVIPAPRAAEAGGQNSRAACLKKKKKKKLGHIGAYL